MRFLLWCAVMFLTAVGAHAATPPDLTIKNTDITFGSLPLVEGQTARVYARVYNIGGVDATAVVTFYVGDKLLGDSQPITVRAANTYDDAWVDFVVPKGAFNIRAEAKGVQPAETNTSNNMALSPSFVPLTDTDGDGIPDTQDNCPAIANADQSDRDHDHIGDVCDAYPDDPTNTPPKTVTVVTSSTPVQPPPVIAPTPKQNPVVASINASIKKTVNALLPDAAPSIGVTTTIPLTIVSSTDTTTSTQPAAPVLLLVRNTWKRYTFTYANVADTDAVAWDFGDGKQATGPEITHDFPRFGSYQVHVRLQRATSTLADDVVPITISFLNIGNPWFWLALVGGVGVVSLIVWLLLRSQRDTQSA